jgi:hypothetical protein
VEELVAEAKVNPPSNLTQILQDITQTLKSQSPQNQIWISTIEKIVNFAQTINIQTQNISI